MLDGFDLDPYIVLGIPRGATAEQVRDAFRRKSLKHHPDTGGDEWAFRIVVRAYQALSANAPIEEGPLAGSKASSERPGPDDLQRGDSTRMAPPPGATWSPVRPGAVDRGVERSRLVQVEIVWKKYEAGDVFALLDGRSQDRQLGGSLTMFWPDPALPDDPRSLPFADRILLALNAAFDEVRGRPQTLSARSHIESGRFEAWLEYPSGPVAHQAFKNLHNGLRARGLGVNQWTRTLTIPRKSPH